MEKVIKEKEQDWFFNFCSNHDNSKKYVKIFGTFHSARNKMVDLFGTKWGFQYKADEFKGQPEEYGLTEIKLRG